MPKRKLTGTVVSNKMQKTAVVRVERRKQHPLYRKVIRHHIHLHAHDEADEARIGDRVVIEEHTPLSRLKRWIIVEWLERGDA